MRPKSFIFILLLSLGLTAPYCAVQASAVERELIFVSSDIATSATWSAGPVYIIDAEVHVLSGVTLTIADGADIRIINGDSSGGILHKNALVFDTGSALLAQQFSVRGAERSGALEARADNGGLWFLGSWKEAAKDGLAVTDIGSAKHSRFTASQITTAYLGCRDKLPGLDRDTGLAHKDDDDDDGDDIDGFSVLGVGRSEWRIAGVSSSFSGDDGFDVTNSNIRLDTLSVRNPTEDGLNISSSRVEIVSHLRVAMTRSRAPDRELFDLEVDDGPSFVVLHTASVADLNGYFGDEVKLTSTDLPQPVEREFYSFLGAIRGPATLVFSIDED